VRSTHQAIGACDAHRLVGHRVCAVVMAPCGQVVFSRVALLVLPRARGEACSTSKSVQGRAERSNGRSAERQREVKVNGKRKGACRFRWVLGLRPDGVL
jgi:hypothetical protein